VQDARERGRLEHGQVLRVLPEVGLRRGLDPVGAVPEVHGVQILREDLVLPQLLLELDREQGLTDLLRDGPRRRLVGLKPVRSLRVRPGVDILHQLLGDRGRALHGVVRDQVGVRGADDPLDVDTGVVVEAMVLGGDHGVDHVRRDLRQRNDRAIDRSVQGRQALAVPVVQVGRADRRQAVRQLDLGVRDPQAHEPQERQHERREQQQEPPAATEEGLLLPRTGGGLGGCVSRFVAPPRRRLAGRHGRPRC
jgi:hypothetical protein